MSMRTKYCPHCCSEKIHKVEESNGSHFHECEECDETWAHHEARKEPLVGSHAIRKVAARSNN